MTAWKLGLFALPMFSHRNQLPSTWPLTLVSPPLLNTSTTHYDCHTINCNSLSFPTLMTLAYHNQDTLQYHSPPLSHTQVPFSTTVTHSGAIHHHCHTLRCHSPSLSHTQVPFTITVKHSGAIHHHCHILRCYSPSLSHTPVPFTITVTNSSAIYHHCHTLKCHLPWRSHINYHYPSHSNTTVMHPCTTIVTHIQVTFTFAVTHSSTIHHHFHILKCHSPSLLHFQVPFSIAVTH